MIYESLVILFFILIVIRSILSEIKHQKLIELSATRLAQQHQQKQKKPKQRRFEFIEDETDNILLATDEEEEIETYYM